MRKTEEPLSPDYGTKETNGDLIEEPAPNARQGVVHHNVRTVLAVSTSVAVGILAIVYLIYFA